jgi:hypothetical protein
MTSPINSINQYQQPLTGLSDSQIQNLQLQNVDTEKIRKGINDSPVVKVTDQKNPWLTVGVFLPTWLAVYVGMNKFSQISRGDYDKSTFAKMDKLNDKIVKSKAIDNKAVKSIKAGFQSTIKFLDKNIVERSAILKSMLRTPSVPENRMIHTMAGGIKAEIASSASQLLDKFTNNGTDLERIKKLGFVKKGKADVERYKDVIKNSHKYTTEIMNICQKQAGNQAYTIERGGKIPLSKYFTSNKQPAYLTEVMPITKKIFCKTVYFSEYANKLRAVQKPGVAKTVLKVIEGMTNAGSGAVGGGALVSLMGAWFVGDAIVRTIKAPKGNGERGKTFAENMIYNLGFYLTMPLGIKIMHSVGGLQYIGMSKEQVEAYRTKLEDFNKKAKEGTFASKAEYNTARQELANMRKGTTRILKTDAGGTKVGKFFKNIIHRPLKGLSSMFMVGLETPHPLRSGKEPATFLGKAWRGIKEGGYWSKQGLAYPVRLIAFMFVLAPFLAKFFAKGSHVLFGKPTNSILDEGKEDKKNDAVNKEIAHAAPTAIKSIRRDQPPETVTMRPINRNADLANNQINDVPRQNLIDTYKAQHPASVAVPVQTSAVDKFNYQPLNQNTAPTTAQPQESNATYTYIPSSEGVKAEKKQGEMSPQVQAVLAKANKAEQIANGYIS